MPLYVEEEEADQPVDDIEVISEEQYNLETGADDDEEITCFESLDRTRRMVVGYLFEVKYEAESDISKWDGIAKEIRDFVGIPSNTKLKPIFESVENTKTSSIEPD